MLKTTRSFLDWFLHLFALTINQKLWNLVYTFLIILFFPSCWFVFLFFPWSLSDGCLLPSCKTQHDHWYMWSVSFIFPAGVVITIILFTHTHTHSLSWPDHIAFLKISSYQYQLPPGETNHTCGGADVWADFISATELFCSAGFYCPTTTQKNPCNKGYLFFFQIK